MSMEKIDHADTLSGEIMDVEMGEKEKLQMDSSTDNSAESSKSANNSQDSLFNRFINYSLTPVTLLTTFLGKHQQTVKLGFYGALIIGYIVYFILALNHDLQQAQPLIALTLTIIGIVLYEVCKTPCMRKLKQATEGCCTCSEAHIALIKRVLRYFFYGLAMSLVLWLIVDVLLRNPQQIISLFGLLFIMVLCICTSKFPKHINWRVVCWGLLLQLIIGLVTLRTSVGYDVIKFVGDEVAAFMAFSDEGSKFVFGEKTYLMHYFVFKVLPMIVFFSTVMNMLYHVGLVQWSIAKLALLTQITLGTSAIESTVAIANIFVGMTEAPLVVRPYLEQLTKAEIHSVLTAGLGSIAFSVFGVYVDMGVDRVHLLTACVMSAPASLVISRMLYPEREQSKFISTRALRLTGGRQHSNIVEAAAAGASMSIGLVANIAANLIAFLALLAFVNATLAWFGSFVGADGFSFQVLCGYMFVPVAFLMGVDWEDCYVVGQLFGIKIILNEFISYSEMKPLIANRLAGTPRFGVNGTQIAISERSEVIATHALCGFCSVSSMGIIIGGLGVLMPSRTTDLAQLALRSLAGGILTCCMTASIAGLLFMESVGDEAAMVATLVAGNVTTIAPFATT